MFNKLIIAIAPWRVHWSIIFTIITMKPLSQVLPASFQGHWYTLVFIIIFFMLYFSLFNFLFDRALLNTHNVTRYQQLVWQAILISVFALALVLSLTFALII